MTDEDQRAWRFALFISRQEQKVYVSGLKALGGAFAHAALAGRSWEGVGLPPKLSGWAGRPVLEFLSLAQDPEFREHLAYALAAGGAVALKCNGDWLAVRVVEVGASSLRLAFRPVEESDAEALLHIDLGNVGFDTPPSTPST